MTIRKALLAGLALLLPACVSHTTGYSLGPREALTPAEQRSLFSGAVTASDSTYGYTRENPIRIGRYGPFKGMQGSNLMLNQLSRNGQPLRVLWRQAVFTGRPDTSEAALGPFSVDRDSFLVDRYYVTPEGGRDTLMLHFDVYYAAPVQVPQGLALDSLPSQ